MGKLILEKTEEFDKRVLISDKKKLEEMLNQEFNDFSEICNELYDTRKFTQKEIWLSHYTLEIDTIKTLPFIVKEWPIYYKSATPSYGFYTIAKIKVKE